MNSKQIPHIKIFAGIKLLPDLKEALKEENTILSELNIITYQGKEYLGFYLQANHPTISDVKAVYDKICSFPHFHRSAAQGFVVFPQIFLGS